MKLRTVYTPIFTLRLLRLCCTGSLLLAGCLSSTPPQSTLNAITATPSPTFNYPGGEKAAKVIFKIDATNGSFDSFPSAGTPPGEGKGFAARRVFRPDNTVLSAFPPWLTGVEVGISGTGNTAAIYDKCARFATAEEVNLSNCIFGGGNKVCSAPGSYYRVSEVDCTSAATLLSVNDGDGSATDGIYIRAYFSRDTAKLAAHENILAVIEYSATSFHKFQSDPKSCMSGVNFSADNCSDFSWKVFLRSAGSSTVPQPFMTLIPRMTGYVEETTLKTGGEVQSKQVILPLASDGTLNLFQISRTKSRLKPADLDGAWNAFIGVCGESTPLCAGTVFQSITFYRI